MDHTKRDDQAGDEPAVFDDTDELLTEAPHADRTGTLVTGLYDSPDAAGRAYEGLTTRHGYAPSDINVLMTDQTRERHFGDVKRGTEFSGGTKAAEGYGGSDIVR